MEPKRLAAGILAFALLFGGCARQDMSQQDLDQQMIEQAPVSSISSSKILDQTVLRLPILDSADQNPFSTAGIYPSITPLLYQSLYRLDEDYRPEAQLAQDVVYTEGGYICTVTVRDDVLFSDGTPLTAKDVNTSLRQALKHPANFPELCAVVENCRASENTVIITLAEPDRNFTSLLTFPVCQSGTQAEEIPVGSGVFVMKEPGSITLKRNPYCKDPELNIKTIELIPVSERESLEYMLKIGAIDFYSMPDSSADSHSYGSSEYFPVNRLTYLGVNRKSSSLLAYDSVLKPMLEALNKEQLISYAFGSTAQMTDVPFHPGYWEQESSHLSSAESEAASSSEQAPEEPQEDPFTALIEQFGYDQKDEEGYWIRTFRNTSYRLSFDILVNTENEARMQMAQLMQEQLAEYGVELTIISKSYTEYLQAIAYQQYDFYIGETQLGVNMDLSHLFTEENAASLGFSYDPVLHDAALRLKRGEIGYTEFLTFFEESSIIEPLCYRRGGISYSRNLTASFIEQYRELLFQIQWY